MAQNSQMSGILASLGLPERLGGVLGAILGASGGASGWGLSGGAIGALLGGGGGLAIVKVIMNMVTGSRKPA